MSQTNGKTDQQRLNRTTGLDKRTYFIAGCFAVQSAIELSNEISSLSKRTLPQIDLRPQSTVLDVASIGTEHGTSAKNKLGGVLDWIQFPEPAIRQGAQVVHRGNAGVLQLARDPGFVVEAAGDAGIGVVPFEKHLDRDFAAERRVGGALHGYHPAPSDLRAKQVPPGCN